MNLRPLGPADLEAVTALDSLCFPPDVAFSENTFHACLTARACESFGVDGEGGLIAFAIVHFSRPGAAQIFTVDVHPRRRGQGLADSLMTEIERRAVKRKVKRIFLQVATDNQAAIGLYHKWGYSIIGQYSDYYGDGKDAYLMDRVLMETEGK